MKLVKSKTEYWLDILPISNANFIANVFLVNIYCLARG